MTFLTTIPAFRFLPQSEELSLPFRIDASGSTVGPNTSPGFNWYSPSGWDPTIGYNQNDAVYYLNMGWQCLIGNIGTAPGTPLTDSTGNVLPDQNGNPIYPWTNIPPVVSSGSVASDLDPVIWARNHILSILLTSPGERVMRPGYGAGMLRYVFESNDLFTEQTIVANVQAQIGLYEPSITIQRCDLVAQEPYTGIFQIEIQFSVGVSQSVHNISFSLGGQGVEISS
jgi:hypothetical protein